jgi:hypothetical protein
LRFRKGERGRERVVREENGGRWPWEERDEESPVRDGREKD